MDIRRGIRKVYLSCLSSILRVGRRKTEQLDDTPMRCYISGPISGYSLNERRKMFELTAQFIKGRVDNVEIVNPIENGLPFFAFRTEHMRRDLQLLLTCQFIYKMEGWKESRGCKTESAVAYAAGIKDITNEVNGNDDYVTLDE